MPLNEPLVLDPKKNPTAVFPVGESLTKQSFKDECDVNVIVDRVTRGGSVTNLNDKEPIFGDVSTVPEFQHMMNVVSSLQEKFASLDAKIRDRFENDPQKLIAFLNDEKNRDEAESLGLVGKKAAADVPPAAPPPSAPPAP